MDKTILDNFLSDINVKHCLSNYQETNIFNILDLDEIRHSRVLAWLLNPRASHHAGDYFLKALLSTATYSSNEDRKIIEGYDFFDHWTLYNIETYSLSNSIITKEFKIKKGSKESIDIAIFSPQHQFMIFIENKTGSREHSDQTTKYKKELNKLAKKLDWHIGFIFLDWNEYTAKDPSWVSINYDWLAMSLKSYIKKGSCNKKVLQLLTEYHDYLNYVLSDSDNLKPIDQSITKLDFKMSTIVNNHQDFLSEMVEELDRSSLKIQTIENNYADENDYDDLNEVNLYWQNYYFFDTLFDSNKWNLIKLELIKLLGSNKGYEYEINHNGIWVHNKSWYTFYGSDYNMENGWVINVALTEKDDITFIKLYVSLSDINKTDEQLDSFFKAIGHKKQKSSFEQKLSADNITEQVNDLVRLINDIDSNIHLLGK